jgi:hypothetical protein
LYFGVYGLTLAYHYCLGSCDNPAFIILYRYFCHSGWDIFYRDSSPGFYPRSRLNAVYHNHPRDFRGNSDVPHRSGCAYGGLPGSFDYSVVHCGSFTARSK